MIPPEIAAFYARGGERDRLKRGAGRVEAARMRELALRLLPPPPARVLDVGGGEGAHARWLSGRGYEVSLLDPVPLHVELARAAGGVSSAELAGAEELPRPDASADAVLLWGPLYHLVERQSRRRALSEALRVLRPGGILLAAGVSRFASMLSLLFDPLEDPAVHELAREVLESGRHLNATGHPEYFTTAYFHRPEELESELAEAGFSGEGVYAVQGPASFLASLDHFWEEPSRRELLLDYIRRVEREPSLVGASTHFLAVGRRPGAAPGP